MTHIFTHLKPFLQYHFIPLHFFQKHIDNYLVYYSPSKFSRVFDYIEKYQLNEFRKLHHKPISANFPLIISKNSFHIQFPTWNFFFFLLRALAIVSFSWFTDSEPKRVFLGTEMFKGDFIYYETTFILWSIIGFGFYQFALSSRTLDYKFLAVLRMTDLTENQSKYIHFASFGFTEKNYQQFRKFRVACWLVWWYVMACLLSGIPLAVLALLIRHDILKNHPVHSICWFIYFNIWGYEVCAIIYSNYISLIAIVQYLIIKQKSLISTLSSLLAHLSACDKPQEHQFHRSPNINKLKLLAYYRSTLETYSRYNQLYAETADYNSFWGTALSFLVFSYILLIAFIIYLLIISDAAFLVKYVYSLILLFHVILLSTIIKLCGDLLVNNEKITQIFYRTLAEKTAVVTPMTLKLHHMGQNLSIFGSGFVLLNGYQITHKMFKDIIGNIAIYFLLIVKR